MVVKLKIVTPERIVFDDTVTSVSLPTQAGEITILPNHIPLIAALGGGELTIRSGVGAPISMALSGGLVEVRPDSEVVILTEAADLVEDIDTKKAEEARERARKIMEEKNIDEESFADATAELERALTQLRVARKHRRVHAPHHTQKIE